MKTLACWLLGLAAAVVLLAGPGSGADPAPAAGRPWTLDEARAQLRLQPRDPYLQYVVLQLARRANRLKEAADEVEALAGIPPRDCDLDLFASAPTIGQRLQLERMRSSGAAARAAGDVPLSHLPQPAVRGRNWSQLLAARKPEIDPLALCVPADQLFIQFAGLSKLLELMESAELWHLYLTTQGWHESRPVPIRERLNRQLAVQDLPEHRHLLDIVILETAVTASDPFLREGTDITLVFRLKAPVLFRIRSDQFLAAAEKSRPDVTRSEGELLGVRYVHLATPDREIDVWSAYVPPNLHVRSNSKGGLERVLQAMQGKVRRLGDTAEFAYARTLFPRPFRPLDADAGKSEAPAGEDRKLPGADEDGFIYLSEAFLRRLIGPTSKLTERRRLVCDSQLRMIAHAALLCRTQTGQVPDSLEALNRSGYTPGRFNEGELVCPDGGRYALGPDGRGRCSLHGRVGFLTPVSEIPWTRLAPDESARYRAFVADYDRFWRTFFDPLAVRVQVRPDRLRFETVLLPQQDNPLYRTLAATLGGAPEPLDALPAPPRTFFRLNLRLGKDGLLDQLERLEKGYLRRIETDAKTDLHHELGVPRAELERLRLADFITQGLGHQVAIYLADGQPLLDVNLARLLGNALGTLENGPNQPDLAVLLAFLNGPACLALSVRDPDTVDLFLEGLDAVLAVVARRLADRPGWSFEFSRLESANGVRVRAAAVRYGPVKARLLLARIGHTLYLASRKELLDDLVGQAATTKAGGPEGHLLVRLRPRDALTALPELRLGWAENHGAACRNNLGPLASVARAFTPALGKIDDRELARLHEEAERIHGLRLLCPDGGRYQFQADGCAVCSRHGGLLTPRHLPAPNPGSPLGRLLDQFHGITLALTFRDDGWRGVVEIERQRP